MGKSSTRVKQPQMAPEKEQLTVRLSAETLTRLDKLAKKLSRPGLELKRADALRIAVETGLETLENEK